MSGNGWSRRRVAAALAPAMLSACAAPPRRPVISINLTEMGPQEPAPLDLNRASAPSAQLETAFDQAMRMVVPVMLNGKGPFGFVADTGANRTVVSAEVAAACGLPPAGHAEVHGIAGAEPADLALVRRLAVGSVKSNDLEMPVLPRAQLGADGLLGVDILKGRLMSLQFALNRFEIAESGRGAEIGRATNSRIRAYDEPIPVSAAPSADKPPTTTAPSSAPTSAATTGPAIAIRPSPGRKNTAGASSRPQMPPQKAPVPPHVLMRSPVV